MRSLACGTPVLVSDIGWFSELPDDLAYKIPSADMGGNQLADVLEDLIRDRATLREKAKAARAYAKERSPKKISLGHVAFVETGGLFPSRWVGRGFQRIAERMRSLDMEWPGYAAKLRATRYMELTDWHNAGSIRSLEDRRSRRHSRRRTLARSAGELPPAHSWIDDDDLDEDSLGNADQA
jgi:hypothetical protein